MRKRYSPEEIQEAAQSEELERILAEHGVSPVPDNSSPVPRRKFSDLKGFDRAKFDPEQYLNDSNIDDS